MLSSDTRQLLQAALARMVSPVRLVVFTQGCAGGARGREVTRELSSLSDKIVVDERDLLLDRESAALYRVDRAPAIAVVGDRDRGIRFVGVPGGYEIMSLADAILLVSSGDSRLSPVSRASLAAVTERIDLQVFVTPT
jgi:alkyl hydroperoxide reductase subunit AhpF